jgi:hypothetical protein
MRSLLLAGAAGLLCSGESLATDYGRTRGLRVATEAEVDLETVAFEMTIDGEPAERPGGGGAPSSALTRKTVLVDQVMEGQGAIPKKVRRSFETIEEASEMTFGDETRESEREGPLQGLTVEMTRDEAGAVSVEVVEGQEPDDEKLLEGLELTLALDALLPEGEVELGASWELEDAAVRRALSGALDARLFPEAQPEEGAGGERGQGRRGGPGGRGGAARLIALVEWKGKATLAEASAEHEGEPCAVLELELEAEGDVPEPRGGGGGGRGFALGADASKAPACERAELEGTVSVRLEGKLYFSLARRAPVRLELEGELSSDSTTERQREERTIRIHSAQKGQIRIHVDITEEGS